MSRSRQAVVDFARSLVGLNEQDGSFKKIIDIYNSQSSLPRGVKMQYSWEWCAVTCSAIAIQLGYTDIMPVEMGVGELVNKAQQMGIWQENDGYIPSPADLIVYDWQDRSVGDNKGWPDHIGTIEIVNTNSGYMTVIEGNFGQAVKRRSVLINGRYIRGFVTPKYDIQAVVIPANTGLPTNKVAREVIAGTWGVMPGRKTKLESAGYNYAEIQNEVNRILNGAADTPHKEPIATPTPQITSKKVVAAASARSMNKNYARSYITTADLYCRDDAGTNKRALCKIPAGTKVNCYGYYTLFNGTTWLYIQAVINGIEYTGFSSKDYLR